MAKVLNEQEAIDHGNVVALFPNVIPGQIEAPVTDEEVAEYRRIKPLLLKMLREWDLVKGSGGCPVARNLVAPE